MCTLQRIQKTQDVFVVFSMHWDVGLCLALHMVIGFAVVYYPCNLIRCSFWEIYASGKYMHAQNRFIVVTEEKHCL